MKRFVLVSAIIELLAGVILFLAPQLVPDLAQGPGSHMAMGRMYGAAALGLGAFAFQTWRNFDNHLLVRIFLSSFLLFHLGVLIALIANFTAGVFTNPGGAILHLILAVFTAYYLFKTNLANAPRMRKNLHRGGPTSYHGGIAPFIIARYPDSSRFASELCRIQGI